MKLVFVDESSDSLKREYLGICLAYVDSYSYSTIKSSAKNIIYKSGWDKEIEFKGKYLFSISKGDPRFTIDDRISVVEQLLKLNISKKLSRIKFAYCGFEAESFKTSYLKCLSALLDKTLGRAPKGAGKNLIAIHFDSHSALSTSDVREAVTPILNKKGYVLLEDVQSVASNMETIGVLFADIVAYLYSRFDIISNDAELFNLAPQQLKTDGRVLKLSSSSKLLNLIKTLDVYEVKKK